MPAGSAAEQPAAFRFAMADVAKLKGAQDYAGTWTEKKKDGTKGGQTLNINQVGPCMFMTHTCDGCPTGVACAYPLGGGSFCSEPFALYCALTLSYRAVLVEARGSRCAWGGRGGGV